MRLYCKIFVFLYVTMTLLGVAFGQATKCFQCVGETGKCKQTEEVCGAAGPDEEDESKGSDAPPTDAPQPARMIERGEDAASPAPPAPDVGGKKKDKCLTITGKDKKDGKDQTWKGCGVSCEDPGTKKFAEGNKCAACGKDLCNSCVSITPFGWISLLIATICVGLGH